MISDARREANRQNALKSTGPKTAEGKARSSRNAETHGLTSAPGEPSEAYREALAEWVGDLKPRGILERTLTERACRAAWNLRRCDRYEDAIAFRRDRDAAEAFALAEANRVEAIGRRLVAVAEVTGHDCGGHHDSRGRGRREARPPQVEAQDDPSLLVADLRRTAAGVTWLLARWADLGRAVNASEGWDVEHAREAGRLLGLSEDAARLHPLLSQIAAQSIDLGPPGGGSWFDHPEIAGVLDELHEAGARGMDTQAMWAQRLKEIAARERGGPEADAALRKALRALVRSEREKLARLMRTVLKARAEEDRATAADRAMFEESKSISLCLRYAGAASRDFHRAIRDLAKLREAGEGDETDSPQPVLNPEDRIDAATVEEAPKAVETPPASVSPKQRNEANDAVAGFAVESPSSFVRVGGPGTIDEDHAHGPTDQSSSRRVRLMQTHTRGADRKERRTGTEPGPVRCPSPLPPTIAGRDGSILP